MRKLIFLSHIHEEREVAKLIKQTLQEEFSGSVEVFLSTDGGESIPPGSNFLERIQQGLIDCCAAVYLISPKSVGRPWVNFELGVVWSRNIKRNNDAKIPLIPICHLGLEPSDLRLPLGVLNAISLSDAVQLEQAFKTLQKAAGGSGDLKTDFTQLVGSVHYDVEWLKSEHDDVKRAIMARKDPDQRKRLERARLNFKAARASFEIDEPRSGEALYDAARAWRNIVASHDAILREYGSSAGEAIRVVDKTIDAALEELLAGRPAGGPLKTLHEVKREVKRAIMGRMSPRNQVILARKNFEEARANFKIGDRGSIHTLGDAVKIYRDAVASYDVMLKGFGSGAGALVEGVDETIDTVFKELKLDG